MSFYIGGIFFECIGKLKVNNKGEHLAASWALRRSKQASERVSLAEQGPKAKEVPEYSCTLKST